MQDLYLGTTEPMRAAHRFYEKSGFVEIALEELPPAVPRLVVDTKFFRRVIAVPA